MGWRMERELPTPDTSPGVYREYIERRLCWRDGAATHASSGQQRQCPKCRCKWSYERLALELRLFEEYVLGRRAAEAVRFIGCAKNTALGHFREFHTAVEEIVRDRLVEGEIATSPTSLADLRSLERALRAGSRIRRRLACRHLFFRSLTLEERTNALFESTLAEEARERALRMSAAGGRTVFSAPARLQIPYGPTGQFMPCADPSARPQPTLDPTWQQILESLSRSLPDCPEK